MVGQGVENRGLSESLAGRAVFLGASRPLSALKWYLVDFDVEGRSFKAASSLYGILNPQIIPDGAPNIIRFLRWSVHFFNFSKTRGERVAKPRSGQSLSLG